MTNETADPDEVRIDAPLVARLVAGQFPEWGDLPVTPVEFGGVDNRTFHLGTELSVRLPSSHWYREQVAKEHRWLPVLAEHLPLPIPRPVAMGEPADGYPWHWSVYSWLDGVAASAGRIADLTEFATTLAGFLAALMQIDPTDGPAPGQHNFFRGGPLETYDEETRRAIEVLGERVDAALATEVWEAALAARWQSAPVWFHGDVAAGNLLVRDGKLGAVIDFGTCGVGDPACDVVIAWTLLSGESRAAFRETLPADSGMWARGRGWALWKALIMFAGALDNDPESAAVNAYVVGEVLADHLQSRAG
ncbi:MAG: aminoglycoside phosphotransferase family protein [Jatrophihabitans sp.]